MWFGASAINLSTDLTSDHFFPDPLLPGSAPAILPPMCVRRAWWLHCLACHGSLAPHLRNWVFSQHFNLEPSGDDLPHLGLWGAACLVFFLLVSNRDHFRLQKALGEMAINSRKLFPVLLVLMPMPVPVLNLTISSKRAASEFAL